MKQGKKLLRIPDLLANRRDVHRYSNPAWQKATS